MRPLLARCHLLAPYLLLTLGLIASCSPAPERGAALPEGPYAVVLGTAQDGGLPQLGCRAECCERARRVPGAARAVASLLVVDPQAGQRWLLDATPDLADQVERARAHQDPRGAERVAGRPPLFDGILLTHAHMGHCLGLLHLGREAYGARGQRVICTPAMASILREEAPWRLLVEAGHIELVEVEPGGSLDLSPRVRAEALPVPHRGEFSDTVGWRITTPEGALLHLPDIDKWERWDQDLRAVVDSVDLAFLDATFFDGGELPGRDMAEVPHPFVVETLERTRAWTPDERAKVHLIHLNHSNPLHDPASAASKRLLASGLNLAKQDAILPLGSDTKQQP